MTQSYRNSVFTALQTKNVAKALVHFSGGGDEGGVNSIELVDSTGKIIETLNEYYEGAMQWDSNANKWIESAPPTDEQKLSRDLCCPVYEQYHSFAGEFYVNGTVIWDVKTRKVTNEGIEEVRSDESFSEEI